MHELRMTLAQRLIVAALILLIDFLAFAVPLMAIVMAYVIVARPARFLQWVLLVYDDRNKAAG
jgi:hypothetical protein